MASTKKIPAGTTTDTVYQLKISLPNDPVIWRRVLVRPETRLDLLHRIFQAVMGWGNYHLHVFEVGKSHYGQTEPELNFQDETEFTLGQLLTTVKQKMVYEYDFGDSWRHKILLERILPAQEGVRYPVCIAGARACPPEDCGGLGGYEALLEAISDEDHEEHDAMIEWIPGSFNPEAFNVDWVNARLDELRPKRPRVLKTQGTTGSKSKNKGKNK